MKYLHISKNVFRTPVEAPDPADPEKTIVVGHRVGVENKGHTYDNSLERHLRKRNPDVFFHRGGKGPVEDIPFCFMPGSRVLGTRALRLLQEEALSA